MRWLGFMKNFSRAMIEWEFTKVKIRAEEISLSAPGWVVHRLNYWLQKILKTGYVMFRNIWSGSNRIFEVLRQESVPKKRVPRADSSSRTGLSQMGGSPTNRENLDHKWAPSSQPGFSQWQRKLRWNRICFSTQWPKCNENSPVFCLW
jgi:hypothetical protein